MWKLKFFFFCVNLSGQVVYSVRMQCGRELAKEAPCDADIVSSVPESGTAAAHGYARQSGIQFAEVLCKNRYVGRTFIQPSTRLRQLGVAKKFGALMDNVYGKKIVLIDDSIVRGNTIGPIIKLLRDAGAKEVSGRKSISLIFWVVYQLHEHLTKICYYLLYRFTFVLHLLR